MNEEEKSVKDDSGRKENDEKESEKERERRRRRMITVKRRSRKRKKKIKQANEEKKDINVDHCRREKTGKKTKYRSGK